ncbi:MAG: circadian clock KaiB family protein [Gemmatimonadaceae bacterium]
MHTAPPGPGLLRLRLYVAGHADNSQRAIVNLKVICEQYYASAHDIEIVDLLEEPLRALQDGILVTPTLTRVSPLPMRRVIGNLSDTAKVLQALGGG